MNKNRGFSLMELMIAVVIVGILAAIALPSYQNSVRKGRRANAQSYMMALSQKEQQYFLDRRSYTTVKGAGGLDMDVPSDVAQHYAVEIELSGPPPGFTITATAQGKQSVDGNLTLDSTGAKSPADKW